MVVNNAEGVHSADAHVLVKRSVLSDTYMESLEEENNDDNNDDIKTISVSDKTHDDDDDDDDVDDDGIKANQDIAELMQERIRWARIPHGPRASLSPRSRIRWSRIRCIHSAHRCSPGL